MRKIACKALKESGVKPSRVRAVLTGIEFGLPERELKFLASNRLSNKQAAVICTALEKTAFGVDITTLSDGRTYGYGITTEEVMRYAHLGLTAYQLECIYAFINRRHLDLVDMIFMGTCTDKRINCLLSGYSKRAPEMTNKFTPEALARYASLPFSDAQLEQVLEVFSNSCIVYELTKSGITEQTCCANLTSGQIDVYAKPELPAELMYELRVGLHAGLANDQVAAYAKPDMPAEEAHEAIWNLIKEKAKAT